MYTHWQLIKFRDGRRKDPQMAPIADKLSDEDIDPLAHWPSSLLYLRFGLARRPLLRLQFCSESKGDPDATHRPGYPRSV